MSARKVIAATVALLTASALTVLGPPSGAATATAEIVSQGPLERIWITNDLNCQVKHVSDAEYQFYGPELGACATLLAVDGVLYGPQDIPAGGGVGDLAPFTTVSQNSSGVGTEADPYRVETVVSAGSGIQITEIDSYIAGRDSYRTDVRVQNTGGTAKEIVLYRAGDCYLGGSDYGYGFVIEAAGAVACAQNPNNQPAGRVQQWVPVTGGSDYFHGYYSEVWEQVGTKASFPNTCRCAEFIDNGAGISWRLSVPAAGSVAVSHLTNFGDAAKLSAVEAHPAVADVSESPEVHLALSATVTDAATGAAVLSGVIEFYVGNELVCTGAISAGTARCGGPVEALSVALESSHTAVFPGNADYLASADVGPAIRLMGQDVGL